MNNADSHALSLVAAIPASLAVMRGKEVLRHFTLGAASIDAALRRSGEPAGLPIAALHEVHAAETDDASNATAFTLLMAQRARMMAPENMGTENKRAENKAAPILWARESGDAQRRGCLYPPGVAEFGIDPASILYVDAADALAALRAAADAARCDALGAVIIELSGKRPKGFDLTATRRLSLSAQKSGVPIFCLRHDAAAMPTAAYSRWQVASAPSAALEANAPGHPAFAINLLRHRGGHEGLSARLEWNRDARSFFETPDIGAVPALPAIGADRETIRKRA